MGKGLSKVLKGGSWQQKLQYYDYDETVIKVVELGKEELLKMANQPESRERKIDLVRYYKLPLPVVLPPFYEKADVLVHHFVLFRTVRMIIRDDGKTEEQYQYYSVDKYAGSLIAQSSSDEAKLERFLLGMPRREPVAEICTGVGWSVSISLLVRYLNHMRVFYNKYHMQRRNCQHFARDLFKFLTGHDPANRVISPIVENMEKPIGGPLSTIESNDREFYLFTGKIKTDGLKNSIKYSKNRFRWALSFTVSTIPWNRGHITFIRIQNTVFRLWRPNPAEYGGSTSLDFTHWGLYADVNKGPDAGRKFALVVRMGFKEQFEANQVTSTYPELFYLEPLKRSPAAPSLHLISDESMSNVAQVFSFILSSRHLQITGNVKIKTEIKDGSSQAYTVQGWNWYK